MRCIPNPTNERIQLTCKQATGPISATHESVMTNVVLGTFVGRYVKAREYPRREGDVQVQIERARMDAAVRWRRKGKIRRRMINEVEGVKYKERGRWRSCLIAYCCTEKQLEGRSIAFTGMERFGH